MAIGKLLAIAAAIVSAAGESPGKAAPSSPTEDMRGRQIMADFASCVVQRHHREAAHLVLSLGVNHATAQTIADTGCVTAPMSLSPGAFQAALADALVRQEFPTFDPTLIAGSLPLAQPILNESAFAPKPGRTYKPEELQKLEQTKEGLRVGIAFWHFGECVVRANPAGAHALLMTSIASPEESSATHKLRSAIPQCPGPISRADNTDDLRGIIAENFYRLAHCGRDAPVADCDPNRPLVTQPK